jgi:hypothetical protein
MESELRGQPHLQSLMNETSKDDTILSKVSSPVSGQLQDSSTSQTVGELSLPIARHLNSQVSLTSFFDLEESNAYCISFAHAQTSQSQTATIQVNYTYISEGERL